MDGGVETHTHTLGEDEEGVTQCQCLDVHLTITYTYQGNYSFFNPVLHYKPPALSYKGIKRLLQFIVHAGRKVQVQI